VIAAYIQRRNIADKGHVAVEGGVTVSFEHDNWVDFANGSIG
jgi:hypothetical protein